MKTIIYLAYGYAGLIILSVFFGNLLLSLVTGLIGSVLIIALAFRVDSLETHEIVESEQIRERLKRIEDNLEKINSDQSISIQSVKQSTTIQNMKAELVRLYSSKKMIYPEEVLNLDINEKIAAGKTREQAIKELHQEKIMKKPT